MDRPGRSFQDLGLFSLHDFVLYVSCAFGDRRDRCAEEVLMCSRVVFGLLSVSRALVSSPKRSRPRGGAWSRGRYSARSLRLKELAEVEQLELLCFQIDLRVIGLGWQ